tara:strand:+ start:495 stop:944 length:450 start_codon:yes stop_codon:yes gene_type:complete
MRYKNLFFLFLPIGLFLTLKIFSGRQSFLINVQGRAELLSANVSKGELINFSLKPLEKFRILAVLGKVEALESDVIIPLKRLSYKKFTTYTNSKGHFNLDLKPGIYTFFVIKENNAYLNSFDGRGFYKSYKIFQKMDNIIITVISNSYF